MYGRTLAVYGACGKTYYTCIIRTVPYTVAGVNFFHILQNKKDRREPGTNAPRRFGLCVLCGVSAGLFFWPSRHEKRRRAPYGENTGVHIMLCVYVWWVFFFFIVLRPNPVCVYTGMMQFCQKGSGHRICCVSRGVLRGRFWALHMRGRVAGNRPYVARFCVCRVFLVRLCMCVYVLVQSGRAGVCACGIACVCGARKGRLACAVFARVDARRRSHCVRGVVAANWYIAVRYGCVPGSFFWNFLCFGGLV